MVALSRDLISLLISFSVMLTAALAVLPQRIAQSPPQPTWQAPGQASAPRCTTEVASILRRRGTQKAEPGRAWASRSAPCSAHRAQGVTWQSLGVVPPAAALTRQGA